MKKRRSLEKSKNLDGKAVESDISDKQDMSIAVMNLINIEEHLAFTAMKTRKKEYLIVQSAVRKKRIRLMKKLLTNTEGELWCISKHLLATTMRLMETATKYTDNDTDEAQKIIEDAFDMYGLFWMLQTIEEKTKSNTMG
ncbi:MAG: hypothetical protein J4473_04585 [Candidatus Aenigmarchaeota archaeon]|nr:hypothetical protein [Candidatus Aenigmarchaeota archaeon]